MPGVPVGVGSRVSLRYRIPDGMTDVVGHLEALHPTVVVRTKSGEHVEVAPTEVVSVRELSHAPVRNSQIRDLERTAALARPAAEQEWLAGWLLRADPYDPDRRANSAVPLDFLADLAALSQIVDWYARRRREPWLDLPERLLPVRATGSAPSRMLTCEGPAVDAEVAMSRTERGVAYVRVDEDDLPAIARFAAMGFRLHHRSRFVLASDLV